MRVVCADVSRTGLARLFFGLGCGTSSDSVRTRLLFGLFFGLGCRTLLRTSSGNRHGGGGGGDDAAAGAVAAVAAGDAAGDAAAVLADGSASESTSAARDGAHALSELTADGMDDRFLRTDRSNSNPRETPCSLLAVELSDAAAASDAAAVAALGDDSATEPTSAAHALSELAADGMGDRFLQ